MKVLDWGEDGFATAAEAAALRTSFRQEVAVWHKLDHPNVTKVKIYFFSPTLELSLLIRILPYHVVWIFAFRHKTLVYVIIIYSMRGRGREIRERNQFN